MLTVILCVMECTMRTELTSDAHAQPTSCSRKVTRDVTMCDFDQLVLRSCEVRLTSSDESYSKITAPRIRCDMSHIASIQATMYAAADVTCW